MGKPKETFNKKEREKKKLKKRQDKADKMEERKAHAKPGKKLEDMFAYLDENGNLSSVPPDPTKKRVFRQEDIIVGTPKLEDRPLVLRKGIVAFFNDEKGYGFINDLDTKERVFVHANQLSFRIKENDKVSFEVEMGPKGASAVNVTFIK
jgi:cold shock CspA family protein